MKKAAIILVMCLILLFGINIPNALDRVEIDRIPVDLSKFEDEPHAS